MAFNHIHFNQNAQYGARLRNMLTLAESADDQLADVRDLLVQMIDGDGSQISQFDEVVKRFGFETYDVSTGGAVTDPQRTAARNAWLEIDSVYAKRTGSVSGVQAARDQMYNKLRG